MSVPLGRGPLALFASAALSAAFVMSAAPAQASTTMSLVKPSLLAQSTALGAVPTSTSWHFNVVLPSRNSSGLSQFASAVTTPGSPEYHQFLSHSQLMSQYGPSSSTVDNLRANLNAAGLTAQQTGQMLAVSGTVGQVDKLFHINLTRYQYHGRTFVAPSGPLTIPNWLSPAVGFTGLYQAAPVPDLKAVKFSSNDLIQHANGPTAPPGTSETSASSDGMTVTAQLLSQGPRVPGMAVRYLITATYDGNPDTSASYQSLSGSYQGASSLVDSTSTNSDGQFLVDFSLSQPQTVSLDLTVSDDVHSVTVPLPPVTFSGPSALVTNTLTLDGEPGEVIAPWNPSSNPVTKVFGASVLSDETAVHGPANLAVYTAGDVTTISQTDVDHFAAQFGLTPPNASVAYSGPNACTVASCSTEMVPIEEELSLDLQMMETSAPGSNIQIYEAGSLRSALNQVLTQDSASVFSISYGEGEIPEYDFYPTAQSGWDLLAQEANAEGITISVSAGDSGAFEGAEEGDNQPMLSYPSPIAPT